VAFFRAVTDKEGVWSGISATGGEPFKVDEERLYLRMAERGPDEAIAWLHEVAYNLEGLLEGYASPLLKLAEYIDGFKQGQVERFKEMLAAHGYTLPKGS
jgi:hypothetical protein